MLRVSEECEWGGCWGEEGELQVPQTSEIVK